MDRDILIAWVGGNDLSNFFKPNRDQEIIQSNVISIHEDLQK